MDGAVYYGFNRPTHGATKVAERDRMRTRELGRFFSWVDLSFLEYKRPEKRARPGR